MTSQSLYRKWRSQTFSDLVGQEAVVRTLKNALNSGTLAHAYLFTGPRGTGKTTTARLLAKTVNCEHPVNGEPCNQCRQCREITSGNSFNVIEIDAASNRGIDNIRDLREKVMMPPSTGKFKVYVLDEAHMLTTEAFNALLKTLEEPPPYVIFVLATTDVHKMLPTVLSRCQRFDFKRFTVRQIVDHLNFVAGEEHITLDRSAAELIARAAAGGMRDALSLLDQAIAYAGSEIAVAQVQAMLGVADPRAVQKFIAHVAELDSARGLHLIHELSENGADLRQVNIQIGESWRALMLAKAGADIEVILDLTEDETKEIRQTAPQFMLEELTELARIFAQNDLVQKSQGTPQLGLELALLQGIDLHRRAQSGQPLTGTPQMAVSTRLTQTLAAVASAKSASPTSPVQHAEPASRRPSSEDTSPLDREYLSLAAPPARSQPRREDVPAATSPSPEQNGEREASAADGAQPQPTLTLQEVLDRWERVKKRVRGRNQAGPRTAAYLNAYAVAGVEQGDKATIVIIQAAHKVHYDYLRESDYCADVEWALGLELRQPCKLRLLPPGKSIPAPSGGPIDSVPAEMAADQAATLSPPQRRRASPAASLSDGQQADPEASMKPTPQQQASPAVVEFPPDKGPTPVVKKGVVRENTAREIVYSSPEEIKHKASEDPVVQEVVRTFSAKIVNVEVKHGTLSVSSRDELS